MININLEIARLILLAEPQLFYSFTNKLNLDRISWSEQRRKTTMKEMIARIYLKRPFFKDSETLVTRDPFKDLTKRDFQL